jgi:RNA polymerase sigma factor (sigma-70 family)
MIEDFEQLYDRHFPKIYNYLLYALADVAAADDAVSTVFERALAGLSGFDARRGAVEAWLFGIARNAVRDHHRSRRLRAWLPLDLLGERAGGDPHGEGALIRDESRRELAAALKRLETREREILALKFGAAMTNREIARQEGLGESHVGVIIYRAVKKLQALMEEATP